MLRMNRDGLCILCLAALMLVSGCASGGSGGGRSLGQESGPGVTDPVEIARVIDNLPRTRRDVLSADRGLLWTASRDWMNAKFGGLRHEEAVAGQLETHLVAWGGEGPLPVRTRVSLTLTDHPRAIGAVTLEVLALEIVPEVGDLAAADEGSDYSWRLMGSSPELEKAIAEAVLERYELLREGVEPALPTRIGS